MIAGITTLTGEPPFEGFSPQFPNGKVSNLSMSVVAIEQLANDASDVVIGHGTGFINYAYGKYFLVTDRHVLD